MKKSETAIIPLRKREVDQMINRNELIEMWKNNRFIRPTPLTENTILKNGSYFINSTEILELTLPELPAEGDQITIHGSEKGGFIIKQNEEQYIYYKFENVFVHSTTPGKEGRLESLFPYCSIVLLAINKNKWAIYHSVGDFLIV